MQCLQPLLLFCLVFAVHCHTELEAAQIGQVKSQDECSVEALQTLVQKQASMIDKQQVQLDAYKNQLDSYRNQLDSVNNRLDAYENRLDNQADSYKNQVDSYENQFDSYKNQFDSYKNQVDAYKNQFDSYQNQFDSYKNQCDSYQTQFVSNKKQVDSMNTQLQILQRKADATSKSVAFTARIAPSHDSSDYGLALGHRQTVVFDDVVTNIGNAYSHTTGIFTAPVNGTYVFFLKMMSPNKRPPVYLTIVKKGNILGMLYAEGNTDINDQGSCQVSTYLTTGDEVWVRQLIGAGVRGGEFTVFTGFLLHAE